MLDYRHEKIASWLALITSSGTWVCCALPIMLNGIGFSSTVTALFQAIPVLKTVETKPTALIVFSAWVIFITFVLLFRPGRTCPITPELAAKCMSTFRWNKRVLLMSVLVWLSAVSVVYLS